MNLLAAYLEEEGLSQAEFCRRHGFKAPMINQWLSGKRRPGLASALHLERATGGRIPAESWDPDSQPTTP